MADLLTEMPATSREVQQMADTAQAVESKKPKRGRKPADESRARILRARLVVWKQTPESQRVSLRTLAAELGTSHQLLAFYLGLSLPDRLCAATNFEATGSGF